MAITAGHTYWKIGMTQALLCVDAVSFGFVSQPDALPSVFVADPTPSLVDLQDFFTTGVPPGVTCKDQLGQGFDVIQAFSTDATKPNIKAVLLRQQGQAAAPGYVVIDRASIPNASIVPAGSI